MAFVDFKTALDTVDRELLMEKLRRTGLTGRMLKMIGSIYEKTTNEVITQEGCTKRFQAVRGVRQGCPLSPTLFNVLLEDLDESWERRHVGGTVMGQMKIFSLKFVDDVAFAAEDVQGLNDTLRTMARYVRRNQLQVNTAKTKISRKRGKRNEKENWGHGIHRIEEVNSYKYLGFWFTVKNSYVKHLKIEATKAQVTTNAAWGIKKGGIKWIEKNKLPIRHIGKSYSNVWS